MKNCHTCTSLCCRNIGQINELSEYNNEEGVCIMLDQETNKCKIYDTRPLICNVREYFNRQKDYKTMEEWLEVNESACEELKHYAK